jgi:hypothetical protein
MGGKGGAPLRRNSLPSPPEALSRIAVQSLAGVHPLPSATHTRTHLLHDLRKAHGLVDARDGGRQVLEEAILGPLHGLKISAVRGGINLLQG